MICTPSLRQCYFYEITSCQIPLCCLTSVPGRAEMHLRSLRRNQFFFTAFSSKHALIMFCACNYVFILLAFRNSVLQPGEVPVLLSCLPFGAAGLHPFVQRGVVLLSRSSLICSPAVDQRTASAFASESVSFFFSLKVHFSHHIMCFSFY